ncbi:MAG: DNA polymerase I [Phycisphaerales bacterium]|nr:DNA polymerase I [Phycisphaerales bacterium]MCI0674283.1 DNA polymerase I [Phycisphaerales bacterium]
MPTATATKTLYLIDGHAQFFRAYHAIRSGLTSPVTKEPTNLTFGFVGMLLKVLREYKPDYLAVVIDAAGDRETFRSEIYPEYKATRKVPPDDFHPQVERCLEILKMMSVPVVAVPSVEADDAIATIVSRLKREHPDLHIRIVSKDKDLTQLLSDRVELFDVHKDQAVTAADVFETPGLRPEQVVEVLTLMGDSIDNIPGVPGVGPKTAGQLILQYGTVENLLANLNEIKGKRRENLEAAKDKLPMSRRLVELKYDCDVDFDLEDALATCDKLPVNDLLATFRELGFNRFQDELKELVADQLVEPASPSADRAASAAPVPARRLASPPPSTFSDNLFGHLEPAAAIAPSERGEYQTIRTVNQLDELVTQITKVGEFALDTETTSLNPIEAELCGISISFKPKTGHYIATRSCEQSSHLDAQTVLARLKPILEDPKIKKIGHNLKFDINVLRKHGVRLQGHVFDTMVASYLIDATRSSHSLDVLALALLNYTCIPTLAELLGKGRKQKSFDQVPLDQATSYSAQDADITLRLRDCMAPEINRLGLRKLFDEVEIPLVDVLAELEWNGIRVDPDELDRQRHNLNKRIAELRAKIAEAAPDPTLGFNPDSSRQLAQVLFNKPHQDPPGLGLRPLKRGKTGPSTDQEVLERLAGDPTITSPLPRLIVEYRQLTKLVNTYLESLKEVINPRTGRIHASFNQAVAVTGRLSSSDPNLQNIPIRSDIGREIRRAFIAEKSRNNWLNLAPSLQGGGRGVGGAHSIIQVRDTPLRTQHSELSTLSPPNVLLTADYSQIELRMLAHLADDPILIEAFNSGQDIHRAVAAQVFNVALDQVTPSQRNSAKMVNFGIVYGVTPSGLARRLQLAGTDTTVQQAARIINDYKARYSKVAQFLDQCINTAIRQGYVETILKRRRPIPQIHSRDPQTRALGERLAINTVVQGSAADLIKLAMIDIHRALSDARADLDPKPRHGHASALSAELRQALSQTHMIIQIHDELVFEVPRSYAEKVAAFVQDRMQNAMPLKAPLVADTAWSENWIDAK